jgi:alkylhydroperoxidase/carboxymuconolactone decarboxylase family protein YurZ
MSSPSPAYVGRVASAFQASNGNLQTVITALLTDPEAQTEGTGKLPEPVLYATKLLRELNATVTAADALTNQATLMGQTPLTPSSVFSYFSPFYRVPNMTPPPVAPEFQAMNAATVLARSNFAWLVAGNGVSSAISVNLANLQDLANNPPDLVEALNQALFRGEMDSNVRALLTTAASASSSLASRVKSALYAAAASPQYQIQQ